MCNFTTQSHTALKLYCFPSFHTHVSMMCKHNAHVIVLLFSLTISHIYLMNKYVNQWSEKWIFLTYVPGRKQLYQKGGLNKLTGGGKWASSTPCSGRRNWEKGSKEDFSGAVLVWDLLGCFLCGRNLFSEMERWLSGENGFYTTSVS